MSPSYSGAVEAIDRILNRGGEPDDVLRAVVAVLHDRFAHYSWVGIYFVEGDELVLGPSSGYAPRAPDRIPIEQGEWLGERTGPGGEPVEEMRVPIRFRGQFVGALSTRATSLPALTPKDHELLRLVAVRISAVCLVAWDTGGVPWNEVS